MIHSLARGRACPAGLQPTDFDPWAPAASGTGLPVRSSASLYSILPEDLFAPHRVDLRRLLLDQLVDLLVAEIVPVDAGAAANYGLSLSPPTERLKQLILTALTAGIVGPPIPPCKIVTGHHLWQVDFWVCFAFRSSTERRTAFRIYRRLTRRANAPEAALLRASSFTLLEEPMAQHKYSVGQSVRFTPDRTTDQSARGAYTVVKKLPESGGVLQYHVKAKVDGRERVVREDQLER
jgi:hypothetical protein